MPTPAPTQYRVGVSDEIISDKRQLIDDERDLVPVPRAALMQQSEESAAVINRDLMQHGNGEHAVRYVMPRDETYADLRNSTRSESTESLFVPKTASIHCNDCGRYLGPTGVISRSRTRRCDDCSTNAAHWNYRETRTPPHLEITRDTADITYGIEIELAGHRDFDSRRFAALFPNWQSVGDSSIRGGDYGVEFVGGPYLRGDRDDLHAMVEALRSEKFGKFSPDRSCGIHVHIGNIMQRANIRRTSNIIESEFPRVLGVIGVWRELQATLLRCVPRNRRSGSYSRATPVEWLERMANATTAGELAHQVYRPHDEEGGEYDYRARDAGRYNDARYNAMNIHGWFYRGAIEFRMPPSSMNHRKIDRWIDLCEQIVLSGIERSRRPVHAETYENIIDFCEQRGLDVPFWQERFDRYGTTGTVAADEQHTDEDD